MGKLSNGLGISWLHDSSSKVFPGTGCYQMHPNTCATCWLPKNSHLIFILFPLVSFWKNISWHISYVTFAWCCTWLGSPPKFAILSWTHFIAKRWSNRPALSPTVSSNRGMNPKGPSLDRFHAVNHNLWGHKIFIPVIHWNNDDITNISHNSSIIDFQWRGTFTLS